MSDTPWEEPGRFFTSPWNHLPEARSGAQLPRIRPLPRHRADVRSVFERVTRFPSDEWGRDRHREPARSALDSRQLECFIAVAEELNISRAAERLHMSQPPLTRRIHRLERAVGAALFRRIASGMELTDAGVALLERAYRIVELSWLAVESATLAKRGEQGRLEVGYYDPAILTTVPELLGAFVAQNPQVDVRFHRVPQRAQLEYLRDRSIHVAFGRHYPLEPGLYYRVVVTEPLHVAFRTGAYRFAHTPVTIMDLKSQPLVVYPPGRPGFADELVGMCLAAGFTPTVVAEADDLIAALAYVAIGSAIAVVPKSATYAHAKDVAFLELRGVAPVTLTCVYVEPERSPVLHLFVSFLEQRLGQEPSSELTKAAGAEN